MTLGDLWGEEDRCKREIRKPLVFGDSKQIKTLREWRGVLDRIDEAERGQLGIRCVFEDSKGNLWIGGIRSGVFLHDGDTAINFTQENGLKWDASHDSASLHRVFSIGEDHHGNIWFGTNGQGAWRYDGESLKNFTEEDGLASKGVMAIYTDSRGDLWLGGNGVFKFNGESFDRIH